MTPEDDWQELSRPSKKRRHTRRCRPKPAPGNQKRGKRGQWGPGGTSVVCSPVVPGPRGTEAPPQLLWPGRESQAAPSPRPVACLAASVFSGPPSLRLDSFEEMRRAGSSPRLAAHRGSSHHSRPPGRAAPHRWPTLRLPASNPTPLSFLPFFFLLQREESGGGGVAWRAFKNVLVQRLEFCAAGTARHRPQLSPPRPRFVAGSPWTSVPLSLVSWPSPPPQRVSPQLRRLGHCSRLLAELWKPPRLNAAPADVTAACDQSAARGPSVNHSASPRPGECGETAFRGSVAAAIAAPRGAGGGQRGAPAPSCSGDSTWHQVLESQLPDVSDMKMIQYLLVGALPLSPKQVVGFVFFRKVVPRWLQLLHHPALNLGHGFEGRLLSLLNPYTPTLLPHSSGNLAGPA
ncbi:uncharacterized protein LOC117012932 [Rhinolophus ferrumequinum]|uniref:uncharacterized protein LOC117012932 n=1 Tax=Rhinolophus ferrumequinum TaxID=59479 RepID=UPI00140FB9C7|nr:uncharacterized protein LOC117012932 [Rhinolophus ferrumequinum]